MKIGIVGDPHLAPKPVNRLDDYYQTGFNKIEQISQKCDSVIFLGDIFSKPKIDELYLNTLIKHLNYCKIQYNVEFHSIIGNHDVYSEDETNIDNSSLGILYNSDVMNLITINKPLKLDIYNFYTIPVKYKTAKQYLRDLSLEREEGRKNILLVHHEYEVGTNTLCYEDFINTNCDSIFFGHDHKPLDNGRIIYNDFTIYRSGSLLRNIAIDYNFDRQIYYYILENDEIKCEAIQQLPSQDVFTFESLNRENYKKRKFVESIDSVIDKYKQNMDFSNKMSIKNTLVQLGAKETNLNYIEKKYISIGETLS